MEKRERVREEEGGRKTGRAMREGRGRRGGETEAEEGMERDVPTGEKNSPCTKTDTSTSVKFVNDLPSA